MDTLSPFTRRFVALGLTGVAIITLVNLIVMPLWSMTTNGLAQIEAMRFRRAQSEAIASRPLPSHEQPVDKALYFSASDENAALRAMHDRLKAMAASVNVQLTGAQPGPASGPSSSQLMLSLTAEGNEVDIIKFINRIEQGRPLMRLVVWHITVDPTKTSTLQLNAKIHAVWSSSK